MLPPKASHAPTVHWIERAATLSAGNSWDLKSTARCDQGSSDQNHLSPQPDGSTRPTSLSETIQPDDGDCMEGSAVPGRQTDTTSLYSSASDHRNGVDTTARPPFTDWTDYPFLTAKIDDEGDIDVLRQRECFSVPGRPLLNEFVREYFLHVHPNLPVLNEASFWHAFTNQRPSQMPLMLFQAMLSAACSFVSQSCIKRLGFNSSRAARAAFYQRAKTMYDLEPHHDDVPSAQTALLLTYYVSSKNSIINSYWLTIALHHARFLHAHRYYEFTNEKASTLKRIWWGCVCRDRLLSLGLRRPLQINTHDFDFSQPGLMRSDLSNEIHHSLVYSADSKQELVQLLSLHCELAVALTGAVTLLSPLNPPISISHEHIAACRSELLRWHARAESQLHLLEELGIGHDSTMLYSNLLLIYYHSAQLALYNHAIYLAMDKRETVEASQGQNSQTAMKSQVSEPIKAITESLLELRRRNLLGYLPITVVANITLPLAWHIIGAQIPCMGAAATTGSAAQVIYTQAIRSLQTQYEGADQVLEAPATRLFSPDGRLPGAQEDSDYMVIYIFARCPPREYVRISRIIDVSLGMGRFPESKDLPGPLQLRTLGHGNQAALMTAWGSSPSSFHPPHTEPSLDQGQGQPGAVEGDSDGNQATFDDGSATVLADQGGVALQQPAFELYALPQSFRDFSSPSSGGLASLSGFGLTADSDDFGSDGLLVNVFSYD
ncbi:fungal-specific transcription factor domain-containing protein [Aspergillus similis]